MSAGVPLWPLWQRGDGTPSEHLTSLSSAGGKLLIITYCVQKPVQRPALMLVGTKGCYHPSPPHLLV